MAFKAYGKSIRKKDYDLIRKMASVVTPEPIDIYDLMSYEMNLDPSDIVFLYGHAAQKMAQNKKCLSKLAFPEPEKLERGPLGEEEQRQYALNKLLSFKNAYESGFVQESKSEQNTTEKTETTITEDHMLDQTQLQLLEKHIKESGTESWIGTTKNGKVIKLTPQPIKGPEDINMTFAEFYNLRKFMEVFGLKETKIVYKPSASRKDNT